MQIKFSSEIRSILAIEDVTILSLSGGEECATVSFIAPSRTGVMLLDDIVQLGDYIDYMAVKSVIQATEWRDYLESAFNEELSVWLDPGWHLFKVTIA